MTETRRAEKGERRRLRITACRQVASGAGEHGEWRLHELAAETVDGKPVRGARLVSFESFEPGEHDVLVERQDHEQHGVSYRLRRPRGSLVGRVERLERQVSEMIARVERLEERPGG